MKEAGYYCAQAGKWHMGQVPHKAFDEIRDKWNPKEHPGAEVDFVPLLKERPKDMRSGQGSLERSLF